MKEQEIVFVSDPSEASSKLYPYLQTGFLVTSVTAQQVAITTGSGVYAEKTLKGGFMFVLEKEINLNAKAE